MNKASFGRVVNKVKLRSFPWRNTTNPYHILVSEIMLQQTQASRVVEKYKEFIKKYPSFKKLSKATLRDVLSLWQGLGYNRRAKALLEIAQRGRFPKSEEELLNLPGVGVYTARAILAFAYNIPTVFIETNIRTVFIYHFFRDQEIVHDYEILELIEKTLDRENPRYWYYALMDYGAELKKEHKDISKKSKHYIKQSTFKGSDRQLRGKIISLLVENKRVTVKELITKSSFTKERVVTQLIQLEKEKIVREHNKKYLIA